MSQPSLPKMDEMGGAISHADLALGTVVPLLSSSPSPTQSRMRLVARQDVFIASDDLPAVLAAGAR